MSNNSPSSENKPIKLPGQEPEGMQERLLIAFALIGVVLMGMQYFTPSQPPSAPAQAPAQKQQAPAAASQAGGAAKPPAAAAAAPGRRAVQPVKTASNVIVAAKDEMVEVDTDLYKVTFSNRGAVVRSWVLKKFKNLELVNPAGNGKVVFPMAVRFHVGQSAEVLNSAPFVMTVTPDRLRVDFEYSQGEWYARKSFSFQKDSYLSRVTSEVRNSGQAKPHLLYWRGGFGDSSVVGAAASQLTVRYDLTSGFQQLGPGDTNDPQAHRGRFSFAGISDSFFAAVALPDIERDFEIHSLSDQLENPRDKKMEANVGVAVGGDAINAFQLFVGPKDTRLLASISPRLEQLVDFGYFGLLAKPLFLALRWLNDNLVHNYGWAIVVATIIINFLLLPLKFSSLKSMKKMGQLQPQIAAINDKYKGLSLTDPKAQMKNEEVMALYKKHGVNPMGGCVPMGLQIPFFIAFYKVLSSAIELRGADWLWVTDLSRPETLALRVLPIAMIASQFLMQKMTPATTTDPAQQRMMMLMPAMMGFMFYGVSAGLVLYWLTGNLVGIAQQWFFNRTFSTPTPAPPSGPAPGVKKKK
jgi:YidC/Oxa1 family membrane protein insertase